MTLTEINKSASLTENLRNAHRTVIVELFRSNFAIFV